MADVFIFDEEELADEFEQLPVKEETAVEEFDSRDINGDDYHLKDGLNLKSKFRRRSSVYSRMSVKISTSVASTDLFIPSDYDNTRNENEYCVHRNKKRISDFVPIKVLGKGAYGKVNLVQDRVTNKLFAQKQLKKPVINIIDERKDTHDKHIERTLSERQILSNITHHPNIVKLFYALQDSDKFYLFLQYVPGGELFRHLSNNNPLGNVLKESDTAFYAAEMALALHHLHLLGVIYRDLKPENCLLDSDGHLVLTDFGLSKSLDTSSNKECTSIIGTPEYMAPEILKGDTYDYAVDWWSLGCVIYDMMSGKPPFTGNNHRLIMDRIIKNKIKYPFYFSLDAKDLLNKLLNKNPSKRFQVDQQWNLFKQHRFFRKIDWSQLEIQSSTCVPPIVPTITDPILAENFSEEFTSLKPSAYMDTESIEHQIGPKEGPVYIEGFSYTASNSYIERFCNTTS